MGGAIEGVGRGINEENKRSWETSEREAHERWSSGEASKGREWDSGESSKRRDWESSERKAGQEWKSGESDLERQWRSWNEEATRKHQDDLEKGRQGWQSGENATNREWNERMQGNMFQQQEKMARLNAELRGYSTPGAMYGVNQAGGGSNIPPPSGGTGYGRQNPVLTEGTLDAGTSGLGYGEPRAQAKMKTSSGATTEFGTDSGTSANLTDNDLPIQGFEHRDTGPARNVQQSDADAWLNRNVLQDASKAKPVPRPTGPARNVAQSDADAWLNRSVVSGARNARPVKPASPNTTAVQAGGNTSAAARAGRSGLSSTPQGMLASMAIEEGQKQDEKFGSATSQIVSSFFR